MRYTAHFYGCEKGAIGIHYWIRTTVEGTDPDDARLRLYDRFDHLGQLQLTPIQEHTRTHKEREL